MPNLSIKNVPDAVVEKLRQRAAANHRSLQGELMALVCGAVDETRADTAKAQDAHLAARGAETGTRTIEEVAAEHRSRWADPFDGPRGVDIIRTDRDAR